MTVILALALAAGQAAPAPQSMQARFDAASDAAARGDCIAAIAQFEALEKTAAAQRGGMVGAAIAVRKGVCLVATGRADDGEPAIRRGLPLLAAQGEAFAGDTRNARLALASAALLRFDDAAATAEAERALAESTGTARVRPLMLLARLRMFDHDGRALAAIDEAARIVAAVPNALKQDMAAIQTLHARVLMNEGRVKEAYAELKDGLRKQGGLTERVTLAEVGTRSDLAIAALLNHDRDAARLYLAYTGAGRMEDSPFGQAVRMDPPLCGEATGLKRDDMAIVEFSLGADGHVAGVAPIYTPGDREVALAFARAVADWSWPADAVAKIPPFYRALVRVEMRCTATGERTDLTDPLKAAFAAWRTGAGVDKLAWDDVSDARALPLQRAALAAATAAADRPRALVAAAALAANRVAPAKERSAAVGQARALAATLGAPPAVRTMVALHDVPEDHVVDTYRAYWRSLLADPATAADPLAAATLRLLIAQPYYRGKPPADADALLAAVIDAPAEPRLAPLRTNALLQQANLRAANGDLAGAQAAFARTGLSEEQCAMIGLTPVLRRAGIGSDDYPDEANRMGFEGWVRAEFDVAADGSTVRPRAIVAYPPFVFDDAATGIMRGSRYASSFRPSGGVACSANQQSVVFRLQ